MTHLHTYTRQQKDRQTGAVLVMALVLLTVMTLIGVASMTSSSMQMRVASNMQQANIVFQGAQSRVAYVLSQAQGTANAIDVKVNIPQGSVLPLQIGTCNLSDGCPDDTNGNWAASAKIWYVGCTTGFGNSLEAGKGVATRTFQIDATATAGVARSIQTQGVLGVVKNCG